MAAELRSPRETDRLADPRFEGSLNHWDNPICNTGKPSGNGNPNQLTGSNLSLDEYRVYKRRWFMLAVLSLLNFSNALSWLSFSPVTNYSATYYHVKDSNIDWLSTVYMVAAVPVGFVAIWILDTLGLRTGILIGASANVIGLLVRYISTLSFIPQENHIPYIVTFTGQTLCAIAQPFLLFSPTKLAGTWFAGDQRATANMIASMFNPLGLLVSNIVSPALVKSANDIPFMLLMYIIPGGLSFFMAVFGFCSSTPPSPPSVSAAKSHESFFQGLKKVGTNTAYIILFINFGSGFGLLSVLLTLMQQVLCVRGYSDEFAGYCGAAIIGCGIIASFLSSLYVDKSKKFEEVTKICFSLAVLFFIAFTILSTFCDVEIWIFVAAAFFGTFGLAQYPISFELSVECTYPVAEGTSAGFLSMSGQIQGIVLMLISQYCSSSVEEGSQTCNNDSSNVVNDMTVPLLIYSSYVTATAVLFVCFFKTNYRRLEAEQRSAAAAILNYSTSCQQHPT